MTWMDLPRSPCRDSTIFTLTRTSSAAVSSNRKVRPASQRSPRANQQSRKVLSQRQSLPSQVVRPDPATWLLTLNLVKILRIGDFDQVATVDESQTRPAALTKHAL